MQDMVTLITLLWYLIGMTTQGGIINGWMKVMMMTATGEEVITRKENKTRTIGEGMCL